MVNLLRSPALRWSALVFVIALFLRAFQPQTIYFKSDQFRDILTAREILAGKLLTEGPRVGNLANVHLGPLYYYVVALGLSIRDQPIDAFRLLALLNAAGVAGFHLLFRRMLGARAALAAGLVLAAHAIAVLNARAIWNPALVIPTVCVYATGLWLWIGERRAIGLGILLVGAALMVQAHASTVFLLPLLVVAFGVRPPWRHLGNLVGAAAALGMTLPWAAPQIRLLFTGSSPLASLSRIAPGGEGGRYATVSWVESLCWTLAPEARLQGFVAPGAPGWSPWVQAAGVAFALLVVLGCVRLARRARNDPRRAALLGGAILVPGVAIAILPHAFIHYLELTFPFRAVLAVVGATLLGRWIGRTPAALVLALSVVVGLASLGRCVEEQARTDVIERDPDYFDLFRVKSGDDQPMVFPTMNALQNVGRVLALDLGLRPEDLPRRAYGPWWLTFLEDVGFWLREPHHRGLAVRRYAGEDEAIFIRHRDDSIPRPAARQRNATFGAGPFTVLSLRSTVDRKSLEFHLPDHNRPGDWLPGQWLMKGRMIPDILFPEVHFRLAVRVPDPPPARILFLTQTRERRRWERLVVSGTALERVGSLRFRNRYVSEWFRWDRPPPGDHHVEFHSRRTSGKKPITLSLNVIDIWQDR